MRGSARKHEINLATIKKYKDAVRSVRQATVAKKKDEATTALKLAYKALDKAVKKHVIKKNKGARLKSRLAKAIGKI